MIALFSPRLSTVLIKMQQHYEVHGVSCKFCRDVHKVASRYSRYGLKKIKYQDPTVVNQALKLPNKSFTDK